jgi:hypothetical protein
MVPSLDVAEESRDQPRLFLGSVPIWRKKGESRGAE